MSDESENRRQAGLVVADEVCMTTPTNEAIYEAGKVMVVESVSMGREFCKFMIGTSMSAIPIYIALLQLMLPEKYRPTPVIGLIVLIPAALFLAAGIVFVFGYFPQTGTASLDLPDEIERERSRTMRIRQFRSIAGFSVFCLAVVVGLVVTGFMLRIPER